MTLEKCTSICLCPNLKGMIRYHGMTTLEETACRCIRGSVAAPGRSVIVLFETSPIDLLK